MRGTLGTVLGVLLVGCGAPAEQAPEGAPANAADPTAPSAPTAPARQLGTVSGLTGQTSALTGVVSGFLVERTATTTRVQLAADTLFAFDKAELTPAAAANLGRTADLVRAGGDGAVAVTGHTDAKGEDAYNLALSRRRAGAVADWLRGQPGLGERRFDPTGRGAAEPVAPNTTAAGADDPTGRARNRRVVVEIPR